MTAEDTRKEFLRVCNTRRAIAIDMCAQEAFEYWGAGPEILRSRLLRLIKISQSDYDKLVVRYRLKEKYGQAK